MQLYRVGNLWAMGLVLGTLAQGACAAEPVFGVGPYKLGMTVAKATALGANNCQYESKAVTRCEAVVVALGSARTVRIDFNARTKLIERMELSVPGEFGKVDELVRDLAFKDCPIDRSNGVSNCFARPSSVRTIQFNEGRVSKRWMKGGPFFTVIVMTKSHAAERFFNSKPTRSAG